MSNPSTMTRREYEEHQQSLAAVRVLLAQIEAQIVRRRLGLEPPPLKLVK